jgi:hypothetical protein
MQGYTDSKGKPLAIPKHIVSDRTALLGKIASIRLSAQAEASQEARDGIPEELRANRKLHQCHILACS